MKNINGMVMFSSWGYGSAAHLMLLFSSWMNKLRIQFVWYWQFIYNLFFIRAKDEGSNQDESSDNPMQVLDEFRGEKSDNERNTTETSAMQSMYTLLQNNCCFYCQFLLTFDHVHAQWFAANLTISLSWNKALHQKGASWITHVKHVQ